MVKVMSSTFTDSCLFSLLFTTTVASIVLFGDPNSCPKTNTVVCPNNGLHVKMIDNNSIPNITSISRRSEKHDERSLDE